MVKQHGDAGTSRTLDDDIACVPRRVAFLLQRLVVFVDDHGDAEVGARRPGRATRADHDVCTSGGERPLSRHHGNTAVRAASQGSGHRLGPARWSV